MTALLLLALLLCAGAGVCALTRCRMEEGLALAVLGLIGAGYPLALAGGTALLGVLPWLAAAAGAGAAVWRYGVRRTADWRELCQGAALFVLFGALYWWLCRGHWLTDWDDFSHWGRAAKWMFTHRHPLHPAGQRRRLQELSARHRPVAGDADQGRPAAASGKMWCSTPTRCCSRRRC